jgi:hypothetical protein
LSAEASVTSIATDAHWLPGSNAACFFLQMSLELSDAEIRRLRDLEALLTHVVITTLSDVDCQASMDRMQIRDVIGARNPEAEESCELHLKAAKRATAAKEDAEPVLRVTKLMGQVIKPYRRQLFRQLARHEEK